MVKVLANSLEKEISDNCGPPIDDSRPNAGIVCWVSLSKGIFRCSIGDFHCTYGTQKDKMQSSEVDIYPDVETRMHIMLKILPI